MANGSEAVGKEIGDFKQMLSSDVWPEVSHRHISAIAAS